MTSDQIAIASAAISIIAVVITIVIDRRSHHLELSRASVEINMLLLEYYRDLRAWADEVIEVMSETGYLCDLDPKRATSIDFFGQRHSCLYRLSALLDRGRLFLPNIKEDQIGTSKPNAYKGLRQKALDLVSSAIEQLEKLSYVDQQTNLQVRKRFMDIKRDFTSELQALLDTRQQVADITRVRENAKN
jgi:hypothetical protein